MLDHLQPEALLNIAVYLHAKDILNLVSTNSSLQSLASNPEFWTTLQEQHYFSITAQGTTAAQAKHSYLLKAHCDSLESLRWHRVSGTSHGIGDREGHLGCRLGDANIITGGFVQDPGVYVQRPGDGWQRLLPPQAPVWVYGATLTALSDERRAVRFGGFASGGYRDETSNVSVLHYDGNGHVHWEPIQYPHPKVPDATTWDSIAARAYASSILLFGRYLFVVGGMQGNGSILSPILLDTETWTFRHENITKGDDGVPSPRHGASIVEDIRQRGRLVMFGGGTGSDLLRSGRDNAEVWELNLNGCSSADEVLESLPWRWNCIHRNNAASDNEAETELLSPAERLNFGRCHASFRVGRDSVLLAFGGGRPTCNSILGYRLDQDIFVRPNVSGKLPTPRFTFASVSMVDSGYILFHGGFCTHNDHDTVDDMCVLDVAAGIGRPFDLLPEITGASVVSHPLVTNEEVELAMQRELDMQRQLARMVRPDIADVLSRFPQAQHHFVPPPMMFLQMLRSGGFAVESDDDDNEDDDDYIDEDDGDDEVNED